MHEKGRRLTVVGVVEVDDFLPTVVSHRVDDGAMIIRAHAYGEIQETGGRCQNLERVTLLHTQFRLSDFIWPWEEPGRNSTARGSVKRRRSSVLRRLTRRRHRGKCNRKYLYGGQEWGRDV